ncbi:MFS transporter [Roseibium litorale]|uniref:MFS transporter n=1 Tax=Roseibium litorale TaxID=2803841 RepID=A0ABR9CRC7_9HYPH|nr:MFS transporter [Roseibium litorale]
MSYFSFLSTNACWLGAGFLLTAFSCFGQTFFISMSMGDLRQELGLSHGDMGLIYMAATLGSAAVLPWVGRSVDAYPLHRVALVVMLCLIALCASMASVHSVPMLALVIFGLRLSGQGMMSHISFTAMGRWYSAQRGRAVSIASLGFPAAEASMPLAFVTFTGIYGWRAGWWAAAAMMLFFALPVIVTLLSRPRIPTAAEAASQEIRQRDWTRKEVLRDPVFWAIAAGILAPPCFGTAVMFNQVYLVELRGWSREMFASTFAVMAFMAVVASLILGPLIDRISARRLLPFTLLPLGLASLVLGLVHAPVAAFLFMGLLGISNGFTSTFAGALWPEIYGTRHIGAIRALAFALMVFASAAGPGLIGFLIDAGIPFDLQLIGISAYCAVLSLVLTVAARALARRGLKDLEAA